MFKLFKRVKMPSQVSETWTPAPQTIVKADPLPVSPSPTAGRVSFNIVLVVKEHAPDRIKILTQRIDDLRKEMDTLSRERFQLEKLMDTLNTLSEESS